MGFSRSKRKRRLTMRKKRTLDPSIAIDYKKPDVLKRFITDRGKIIPRRISGATAKQQRRICLSIKRARYLGLLPFCVAHRSERGFAGEMALAAAGATSRDQRRERVQRERGSDTRRERPDNATAENKPAEAPAVETKAEEKS